MNLVKLLNVNGAKYLYDAFENSINEIDEQFYGTLINNKNSDLYESYLKKYNLRDLNKPINFDIKYPYHRDELIWQINNMQRHLVLSLTENCNMRCHYCGYYDSRYYKKSLNKMSKDTAFKAIDLFLKSSTKHEAIIIGFYGGEALLEFDLIKECIEYADKYHQGQDITYVVSTNGILLESKQIVKFLVDNKCDLIVSLDGPESLHDRYRIDLRGEGTYKRIKENLKYIQKNYPDYFKEKISFNTVITSRSDLDILYDYFDSITNNVTLINVSVTETFRNYMTKNNITINDREKRDSENIDRNVYNKANIEFLRELKRYKTILEMMKTDYNYPGGYCIPLAHKLYVNSSGDIFFCERVNESNPFFCVGNVKSGIDYEKVENIMNVVNDDITKNRCKDCWALRFCSRCFINCKEEKYTDLCERIRSNVEKNITQYIDVLKNDPQLFELVDKLTM